MSPQNPPDRGRSGHILVIGDNPSTRGPVAQDLRGDGFEVEERAQSSEGPLLGAVSPDLIVVDLFAPEEAGIETIEQLRQLEPGLPILAITNQVGWGDFLPHSDALEVGANQVLERPLQPDRLIRAVHRLLRDRP